MPRRKVFLVFFDWDRDTITPDGMAIIQQAADAFRAGGRSRSRSPATPTPRARLATTSGSPSGAPTTSPTRWAAIGVPRQAMVVSGRGENDKRVPTADGVREPQNRRVEIVFP